MLCLNDLLQEQVMNLGQDIIMFVGDERRDLVVTPHLATQWATVERYALPVLSVTATLVPVVWVDTSPHPEMHALARLSLQSATWEATCRWLALLTTDGIQAETFLCLEVTRPLAYPLVIHFHLMRHRELLRHIAMGGAFHLGMEAARHVIPFVSASARGLAEQLAAAEALAQQRT